MADDGDALGFVSCNCLDCGQRTAARIKQVGPVNGFMLPWTGL